MLIVITGESTLLGKKGEQDEDCTGLKGDDGHNGLTGGVAVVWGDAERGDIPTEGKKVR